MTRVHVPVTLRWSDLDAYGHVNNARLLTLLEEARIEVFWPGRVSDGAPLPDMQMDDDTLSLIARQEIEYLAPLPHVREPLDIELWLGSIGGASLEVNYEVHAPRGAERDVLFARAATTLVMVDARTTRPRRISARERALWEPYLEAPLEFRRR